MVGFRSYGLIRLLGLSGPNVVYRTQTLKARNFLRYQSLSGRVRHNEGGGGRTNVGEGGDLFQSTFFNISMFVVSVIIGMTK